MSDVFPLTDHPAVQRAFANPAGAGDNAIVAAVPGKKIKILALIAWNNVATAQTIIFKSAAAAISPSFVLPASVVGAVDLEYCEAGWFLTNVGEAFNVNLSAATAVGVHVIYTTV